MGRFGVRFRGIGAQISALLYNFLTIYFASCVVGTLSCSCTAIALVTNRNQFDWINTRDLMIHGLNNLVHY